MRAIGALILAWALSGCGISAPAPDGRDEQIARLTNELAAAQMEAESAKQQLAQLRAQAAVPPPDTPMHNDDEFDPPVAVQSAAELPNLCWQDYCPCDETGPIDRSICRDLRGGVEVTTEQFSIGATARDIRRDD